MSSREILAEDDHSSLSLNMDETQEMEGEGDTPRLSAAKALCADDDTF